MTCEHSFQSGDFVEIDIFVYKFGWINRNLCVNDKKGHREILFAWGK